MGKLTWHNPHFEKENLKLEVKKDLKIPKKYSANSEISPGTGELKMESEAVRRKGETEA